MFVQNNPSRYLDNSGYQSHSSLPGLPTLTAEERRRISDTYERAGESGGYESFTTIPTPEFEEGTPERLLANSGAQFAVARRFSPTNPEFTEDILLFRIQDENEWSRIPNADEWREYNPRDFDRGELLHHDPWGQAGIDFVLTLGIGAVIEGVAAQVAAARLASESGGVILYSGVHPQVTRAGVYRSVTGPTGARVLQRVTGGVGLASEGSFVVRHTSGLVSYIRTGISGRIERVRATLLESALRRGTGTGPASRASVGAGEGGPDAGHLLGRLLGGNGGANGANLFPQLASINRGVFAQWERFLAEEVYRGASVGVDISIVYAGRPVGIIYQAVIDGVTHVRYFPN
jgi:hypothetical protein